MNKFQQACLRCKGVWKNDVMNIILEFDCAMKYTNWSCVQLNKFCLSNTIPPRTRIYWFKVIIQEAQTHT